MSDTTPNPAAWTAPHQAVLDQYAEAHRDDGLELPDMDVEDDYGSYYQDLLEQPPAWFEPQVSDGPNRAGMRPQPGDVVWVAGANPIGVVLPTPLEQTVDDTILVDHGTGHPHTSYMPHELATIDAWAEAHGYDEPEADTGDGGLEL